MINRNIEIPHEDCVKIALMVYKSYKDWLANGEFKYSIPPFDEWLMKNNSSMFQEIKSDS